MCPGFSVLRGLEPYGTSGAAAQTGTAAHKLIELLHRGYSPEDAASLCRVEAADLYPQADLAFASMLASGYWLDPRWDNDEVVPEWLELEVKLELPADAGDPTGEPIKLTGHVDQIRRGQDGQLRVWDVKTSRGEGGNLVHSHAWQLAAYALAASNTLGEQVLPGGIIRLRGYIDYGDCPTCSASRGQSCATKTGNPCFNPHKKREVVAPADPQVFHLAPWSLDQCSAMLETVSWLVAAMRRGEVPTMPGDWCRYCPASGPATCSDEIGDALAAAEAANQPG